MANSPLKGLWPIETQVLAGGAFECPCLAGHSGAAAGLLGADQRVGAVGRGDCRRALGASLPGLLFNRVRRVPIDLYGLGSSLVYNTSIIYNTPRRRIGIRSKTTHDISLFN